MSSALAMVLMAAMAIPGNGPEMVSAEMEQGLDLRGDWEGTCKTSDGTDWEAQLHFPRFSTRRGHLTLTAGGALNFQAVTLTDEGAGRLRITWSDGVIFPGIYEQQDDRAVICFSRAERGYPTEFRGGDGQHLLILRRVKPRK
jgi:hypothetical protein